MSDRWSKAKSIPNAYSDEAPALCGQGSTLYAVYKSKGTNDIYVVTFSDDSWGTPVKTSIQSSKNPSLAIDGSQLYLFWRNWGDGGSNSKIDYGQLNPTTGYVSPINGTPIDGNESQVGDAKSTTGPAGIYWNAKLRAAYKGKSSADIYYSVNDPSGKWDANKPNNKKTQHSPVLAGTAGGSSTLYMFHTGEGSKSKQVMMGTLAAGASRESGWTKDVSVPDAKTKDGPGCANWADTNLVLVHNGEDSSHLLWHFYDIANDAWHYQHKVGNDLEPIKSKYNPALWYLPKPGDERSKMPYGMYLLYVENENDSGELRYSVLEKLPQ